MKAILKTRCGCTRMIDVPEYTPVVRLPLADSRGLLYAGLVSAAEVMDSPYGTRDFRLVERGVSVAGGYPFMCAMYEEDPR